MPANYLGSPGGENFGDQSPARPGNGTQGQDLIPSCNQKTIIVILSVAKNLAFLASEIRNEAALRSE
jgi:hypothetical protein